MDQLRIFPLPTQRKEAIMQKPNRCLWTAPALTGGLLLVVYAVFSFFPFGNKSITWCDMTQQVIPLMGTFGRVLTGDNSAFLDMGAAGGMNFWGVFFFFLASPLSIPAALVPLEHLPFAMNILLLLKMMLCAFTASLFFRRFFPEMPTISVSLLGMMYAFSGFALNYYQNIVWLDMMALFPLLLLALTAMIAHRKLLPFVLCFSAMLAVNYYLSYMVVLFLILGMGLFQFFCIAPKRSGDSILLLGTGAILSLLLTAPVWLPSLLEVMESARGQGLIASLSSGKLTTDLYTSIPVLFCSALPAASLLLLRRRQTRSGFFTALAGCILLLLIPVILNPINKMWHTGSYQSFPVRYGYMMNFLFLLLAAEILSQQDPGNEAPAVSKRWAKILLPLLTVGYAGGVIFLLSKWGTVFSSYTRRLWGDQASFWSLAAVFAGTALLFAVVLAAFRSRQASRRLTAAVLIVLALSEAFFNSGVYIGSVNQSLQNYWTAADLSGRIRDDDFYRLKTSGKYFAVNFFSAMGYHSLSHYTSLTPESYLTTIRRLGYSGYWMEVNSNGGTAFSDALLGNRYILRRLKDADSDSILGEETVYWNHYYLLQELPYRLPSALATNAEPGFLAELPETSSRPFLQQELADTLFPGAERMFLEYAPDAGSTDADKTYTIQVEGEQILYFDCSAEPSIRLSEGVNKSCQILVNGQSLRTQYPTQSENGLLELGTFADETVTVTIHISKNISPASFGVFGLDTGVLEKICASAERAEMEVSGNRITAACTAKEGQALFLPVTYDKGWTATVNGEKTEVFRTAGTFLSLSLKEGENQIVLRYTPPGLRAGLLLMGIGLLLAAWLFWKGKSWLLGKTGVKTAMRFIFLAVFLAVMLLVYLLPMTVYLWAQLK